MSLRKTILMLWVNLIIIKVTFGQLNTQQAQLEFDHLVIFTQSKELEDKLSSAFFTLAEKANSFHYEQGTEGHYFFFYNTYIELLYLKDSNKAIANSANFGSDYINRWKTKENYCPIGFGLNLIPFDTTLTKLKFKVYTSNDTPESEYYLMSEFNKQPVQPLIYTSMPHHAYLPYNSLDEVDQRFEAYMRVDQKKYLTHPSGVKRLTEIILTVPVNKDSTGNFAILKELKQVKIENGEKYSLTLKFDNQDQGKEFTLSTDFPLIIKY